MKNDISAGLRNILNYELSRNQYSVEFDEHPVVNGKSVKKWRLVDEMDDAERKTVLSMTKIENTNVDMENAAHLNGVYNEYEYKMVFMSGVLFYKKFRLPKILAQNADYNLPENVRSVFDNLKNTETGRPDMELMNKAYEFFEQRRKMRVGRAGKRNEK